MCVITWHTKLGVPSVTTVSPPGWSTQLVVDAYKKERVTACEKAGIDPELLQGTGKLSS